MALRLIVPLRIGLDVLAALVGTLFRDSSPGQSALTAPSGGLSVTPRRGVLRRTTTNREEAHASSLQTMKYQLVCSGPSQLRITTR